MAGDKPNIVVFFTDQQRWDSCGCYNPHLNLTPNLDAVAADGAVFKRAYTCQPVCGPARAALHRLHRQVAPCAHLRRPRSPGAARYTDYWKAVDVFEWASLPYEGHLYDENNQMVSFEGEYRADFTADLAIDYINSWEGDDPHMLFCSFIEPHHQNCLARYVAPEGYAERYRDAWVPEDLRTRPGEGDWEQNLPDYYGIIKRLDENFGRVVAALKEKGLYDNTLLFFTSDHGSHFRTRNGEYKRACRDACTRIPLVVHGPGVKPGVVTEQLASLIDLPATILDCAGVGVPEHFHGLSLKPLLEGQDAPDWREEVFIQISEDQVGRALCDGRYKYSVHAPGLNAEEESYSDQYVEQFLYDLENDPSEARNLVADPAHAPLRAELAAALIRQIERVERRTARILPREAAPAQWRHL